MTLWGYIGEMWEQDVRVVEAPQSPPRPAHQEDRPVLLFVKFSLHVATASREGRWNLRKSIHAMEVMTETPGRP